MKIRTTLLAYALAASVGCSAAQLAADEAAVNKSLTVLDTGADWLIAHPAVVKAAFKTAIDNSASNPTLQKRLQEGSDAYDNGIVVQAQTAIVLGITATTPVGQTATLAPR